MICVDCLAGVNCSGQKFLYIYTYNTYNMMEDVNYESIKQQSLNLQK